MLRIKTTVSGIAFPPKNASPAAFHWHPNSPRKLLHTVVPTWFAPNFRLPQINQLGHIWLDKEVDPRFQLREVVGQDFESIRHLMWPKKVKHEEKGFRPKFRVLARCGPLSSYQLQAFPASVATGRAELVLGRPACNCRAPSEQP